jgi:cell division protein FtsQ
VERRRRRRKKRIRYVGRRFSIRTMLIFLMLVLTVFFFLHSPYYNVKFIAVSGNSTLSKPRVRALSGITRGSNIFRLNTKEIEEKVLLDPFVASVEAKRDLPDTVVINIVEHESVAVLPYSGGFMEVNGEGLCLSNRTEIGNLNIPVVSGLGLNKRTPPGAQVENEKLPLALKILELSNKNGIIAEVDVHNPSKLYVLTFAKTKILLGNQEQLEEKISLALDITSKVPNAQNIDVRFPKSPVYTNRPE